MKLLTQAIIRALPPIYSTEHTPLKDKMIICKFYIPGGWSWYVFEGEVDTQKTYRFFGIMVHENKAVNETMMGYFYLSDLAALIETGYSVQLDESIFKVPYADILKEVSAKTWPFCKRFLIEKLVRALPPIGSTEHIPLKDRIIIFRFYIPYGPSWYIFEGEFNAENGYRFFGIIDGGEKEWGYFYLSELLEVDNAEDTILIDYSPTFNMRYSDIFGAPAESI